MEKSNTVSFVFPTWNVCWASVLDSLRRLVAVGADRADLNQTANFLMAYGSFLEELSDRLTIAEDTVDRAKGLNLKSQSALHHLKVTLTVTRITSQSYPGSFASVIIMFCTSPLISSIAGETQHQSPRLFD